MKKQIIILILALLPNFANAGDNAKRAANYLEELRSKKALHEEKRAEARELAARYKEEVNSYKNSAYGQQRKQENKNIAENSKEDLDHRKDSLREKNKEYIDPLTKDHRKWTNDNENSLTQERNNAKQDLDQYRHSL